MVGGACCRARGRSRENPPRLLRFHPSPDIEDINDVNGRQLGRPEEWPQAGGGSSKCFVLPVAATNEGVERTAFTRIVGDGVCRPRQHRIQRDEELVARQAWSATERSKIRIVTSCISARAALDCARRRREFRRRGRPSAKTRTPPGGKDPRWKAACISVFDPFELIDGTLRTGDSSSESRYARQPCAHPRAEHKVVETAELPARRGRTVRDRALPGETHHGIHRRRRGALDRRWPRSGPSRRRNTGDGGFCRVSPPLAQAASACDRRDTASLTSSMTTSGPAVSKHTAVPSMETRIDRQPPNDDWTSAVPGWRMAPGGFFRC